MPDAPCGGQGKCGKCRVKIDGKVVLACKTVVDRDMEVDTLKGDSGYEILTEGFKRPILFDPDLKQQKVFLKKPRYVETIVLNGNALWFSYIQKKL